MKLLLAGVLLIGSITPPKIQEPKSCLAWQDNLTGASKVIKLEEAALDDNVSMLGELLALNNEKVTAIVISHANTQLVLLQKAEDVKSQYRQRNKIEQPNTMPPTGSTTN